MLADGRFGNLDLKNIKELSSGAWEATLHLNGKKIGSVWNDGRGGPHSWHLPAEHEDGVMAACDTYAEWCEANNIRVPRVEQDDDTINAILDYKTDQKEAKKWQKKGKVFCAKVEQSDASFHAHTKWAWPIMYAGSATGPAKEIAAGLAAQIAKSPPEGFDPDLYDQIVVLMADGNLLAVPVTIPLATVMP